MMNSALWTVTVPRLSMTCCYIATGSTILCPQKVAVTGQWKTPTCIQKFFITSLKDNKKLLWELRNVHVSLKDLISIAISDWASHLDCNKQKLFVTSSGDLWWGDWKEELSLRHTCNSESQGSPLSSYHFTKEQGDICRPTTSMLWICMNGKQSLPPPPAPHNKMFVQKIIQGYYSLLPKKAAVHCAIVREARVIESVM